jgi:predicted metal-dependent HD superfamily phosphohydrolase
MTRPTYDECLVEAELRARARYAEPGRHYHDQRHLDDCEQRLETLTGVTDEERRVLRWALLWHDAIYDPTRADNEEASAELARHELLQCGVRESDAEEVARLILLTKGHQVPDGDRLGAILVSIDLSILGSDPDHYRQYAEDVRREYTHVPDELWRTGRAAVLAALMGHGPVFPDSMFERELGDQARRNMTEEIKSLSGY